MKIFILDDEIYKWRKPVLEILKNHELTVATGFEDAKQKYRGNYDLLLLDHDMHGYFEPSDNPDTGYQFTKWLVDSGFHVERRPPVIVHSQNNKGSDNMVRLLLANRFTAAHYFYSLKYLTWLEKLNMDSLKEEAA